MEVEIRVQGKDAPPCLTDLGHVFIDASRTEKIMFVLIEEGMRTGEPSVMIVSQTSNGPIILQTSLDKFLMAASGMAAAAEVQFDWVQPAGYASVFNDPATIKDMKILQALEKELADDGTNETPEGRDSPS